MSVATANFSIREALITDSTAIRLFVIENATGLNIADEEVVQYGDGFVKSVLTTGDLVLLAMDDEQVTGLVILRRGYTASSNHTASMRLYVTDGKRSQGLGGELISRALDWARSEKLLRVEATPYIDVFRPAGKVMSTCWTIETHAKLAFFERHGFIREGVKKNAARRIATDTVVDVITMSWTPKGEEQ